VIRHAALGRHVQDAHAARASSRIGRVAAVGGASRIAMSCGGSLADGYQCTIAVSVTGTAAGGFINNSGLVGSNEGGPGNGPSATLTVLAAPAPPTVAIAFGAPTIAQGTSTSLTFTITNPNPALTLTGIDLADPLPGGLVVAYPNGLAGSCGGGFISAPSSSSHVSLSAAQLDPLASCTYSVDIVGAANGDWLNLTDQITSTNGGTGIAASASIRVLTTATIGMSFNPASISPNGTTTLTIGLFNPETNNSGLYGLSFTDTLPAGLSVADGSTTICESQSENPGEWPVLTTSGGDTISVSGVNLSIGWICSFSVTVTGPAVPGNYVNTAGPLVVPEGLPSNIASATLNVLAPPTLAMAFVAPTITIGTHAPLTFTVANPSPNGANLHGVALTASVPSGLLVAIGSQSVCGGTLTTGGDTIDLTGAMVGVGSTCTFSVDVTGAVLGSYTAASGPVTSANAGSGNSATAGVTVVVEAATPAPATPSPTLAPGTTLPPSSTERGGSPDSNGSPALLFLLLASMAGMVVFRRAMVRGR
jgi:hypothetical protein